MPSSVLTLKNDGRNVLWDGHSIKVTESDGKYSIEIDIEGMRIAAFKKKMFSSSLTKKVFEVVVDPSRNIIKYNSRAFSKEINIKKNENLHVNTLADAEKVLTEVIEDLQEENGKVFSSYLRNNLYTDPSTVSPYVPLQSQYVPQYGEELETLDHILKLLRE